MRFFIATTFPAAVLRALNERVAAIKPRLPAASWVRPETQHLTFAFLGDHEEAIVNLVDIRPGAAFEGSLQGCGFFPNRRNARVGWIGAEPHAAFFEVATRVREALDAAGIAYDTKEFRAHLTLMRIRDRWPPAAMQMFEDALRDYRSAPFAVDAVTLYSSRLTPSGAVHTPVRTFAMP